MSMSIDEAEFVKLLDNVLESIFGKVAADLLYDHLKRNYSLSKDQVLQNTSLFIEALISTFGEAGTRTIESEILRAVENKITPKRNETRFITENIDEYALRLCSLTDYLNMSEAKMYVALLVYGELPARKLAKLALIPRTKVYGTARGLREMGFISIRRSNQKTVYRPKNPEKIFGDHLKLMSKRLENFEKIVDELTRLYRTHSLPDELDSLDQLKPE